MKFILNKLENKKCFGTMHFLLIIFIFIIHLDLHSQIFSLDSTFNNNFSFYEIASQATIRDIIFELNGEVLAYGNFHASNGNYDIIRIFENGNADTSCHYIWNSGIQYLYRLNNEYIGLSLNSLGKSYYNFNIIGDTTWINNVIRDNVCGIYFIPFIFQDGSMFVGTDTCNYPNNKTKFFKRILPNGRMDTTFSHYANGPIYEIIKYSNDKLLIYGGRMTQPFSRYDTISVNNICRIDTLGNLDTTFKSFFTGGAPCPLYVQNDGKIILTGGGVINYNNSPFNLIRINADGTLDNTFNNHFSTNYPDGILCVCPTTEGGYLMGGRFTEYQGYSRHSIVKTDQNGYIDTNYFKTSGIDSVFNYYTQYTPSVLSIRQGNNDTYYVMGDFTYYNGKHVNPIIRIKGLSAGINEINQEKGEIKVYPNPATNQIILIYPPIFNEGVILIYNILGQLVYEEKLAEASFQKEINIQSFKAGLYKVVVRENGVIKGQVSLIKN